ncbi:MAG: FAD-dependent oxidoreductase [Tepidisphaeraceae bacterium]
MSVPSAPSHRPIAVIGAGMAGSACAARLREAGRSVVVFDKGRGVGGRMSSRRVETGHRFDHGAPHFALSSESPDEFRRLVETWKVSGVITARHDPSLEKMLDHELHATRSDRYYGSAGMNAPCKQLLGDGPVHLSTRIKQIIREPHAWTLVDEAENPYVGFETVILAVPSAQAAELLPTELTKLRERVAAVRMLPRWVAMFGFDAPIWPQQQDYVYVSDDGTGVTLDLYRTVANTVGEAWVVQADQHWSMAHLELPADIALRRLTTLTSSVFGGRWREPAFAAAHRWRYAFVDQPLGEPCLLNDCGTIGLCGDWCVGWSVESAFISGRAMAEAVLAMVRA